MFSSPRHYRENRPPDMFLYRSRSSVIIGFILLLFSSDADEATLAEAKDIYVGLNTIFWLSVSNSFSHTSYG